MTWIRTAIAWKLVVIAMRIHPESLAEDLVEMVCKGLAGAKQPLPTPPEAEESE